MTNTPNFVLKNIARIWIITYINKATNTPGYALVKAYSQVDAIGQMMGEFKAKGKEVTVDTFDYTEEMVNQRTHVIYDFESPVPLSDTTDG